MNEANTALTIEQRIEQRIDKAATQELSISDQAGGLSFVNLGQVMEFSKVMAIAGVAIPKHLRGNAGACMAVCIQAVEWRMSPFAVANKSYSVNDRLAFEAQLVQAVVLQRAPIKGRIKVQYIGDGDRRRCRVWAELKDEPGEIVEYTSPDFGRITPKNSPLWKSDPDQQQFYYSVRAMCRRHFPDVLLGVYAKDELEDEVGPERARDVTPRPQRLSERLDTLAASSIVTPEPVVETAPYHDPETGEIADESSPDDSEDDGGSMLDQFRAELHAQTSLKGVDAILKNARPVIQMLDEDEQREWNDAYRAAADRFVGAA
jgi:hypothetical protein